VRGLREFFDRASCPGEEPAGVPAGRPAGLVLHPLTAIHGTGGTSKSVSILRGTHQIWIYVSPALARERGAPGAL